MFVWSKVFWILLLSYPLYIIGAWTEDEELTPAAVLASDGFGSFVAIEGTNLVVSAIGDDGAGSGAGTVYAYEWSGTSWGTEVELSAPVGLAAGYSYGSVIAMDGTHLVIGAYGANSGAGTAFFSEWSGSAWSTPVELTLPVLASSDNFGKSLQISGTHLVVGSPVLSGVGTAYAYEWSGSSWGSPTELTLHGSLALGDVFGRSVALSGDNLVVGAFAAGGSSGAIYSYEWSGSAWVSPTQIIPSGLETGDQFGQFSYMSGNHLAVSSTGDDDIANAAGAVYTFEWSGSAWVEGSVLRPTDLQFGWQFGSSIVIHGNSMAISLGSAAAGKVYMYEWSGSSWVEGPSLTSASLLADDFFGSSVGISNDHIIVSAMLDDGIDTNAGTVYSFTDSVATPTTSPTGAPTQSPTQSPTLPVPTSSPTKSPSASPTGSPTLSPTPCFCENGGFCVDNYCVCTFPWYGLRCNNILTCSC